MKITRVARAQMGTNWIKSLRRKTPTKIITPVIMFAKLDLAPLATLRVERVKEPEAGIPENKAHPRFPMPIEKVSWLASIRPPARADNDLPIDSPSRRQSIQTASEVLTIREPCW